GAPPPAHRGRHRRDRPAGSVRTRGRGRRVRARRPHRGGGQAARRGPGPAGRPGAGRVIEPDFLRATRASYDAVAAAYAARFDGELVAKPLDRGMLDGFAELVLAAGAGPVADI